MIEQFAHFLLSHWILSTAFIVIILLLTGLEFMNNLVGVRQISPQEATHEINHQDAMVIDIRPADRFKQGHIIGAINIPSTDIDKQYDNLKSQMTKATIIVCETGKNAATIAALLKKQGFTLISVLKGGLKTWKENQLPLIKK